MTAQSQKNSGICLLIFTSLMLFTMVLHPVGGNFEQLLKVRTAIIVAHAIALSSIPFGGIGFWGLSKKLGGDNFLSVTAFAIILFGLLAVMMSAAANGLVLPIFIERYKDASPETIESLRAIIRYNFSVNNAFDYIYTVAFCTAMLLWSAAILHTRKLSAWIGWLGIILSLIAAVLSIAGIASGNLTGFRLFVITIIIWIAAAGFLLIRDSKKKQ